MNARKSEECLHVNSTIVLINLNAMVISYADILKMKVTNIVLSYNSYCCFCRYGPW